MQDCDKLPVTTPGSQLERFVSKERSVSNSRRSPSSYSQDDVVPSSASNTTPNSGSASKTYHQPVTPDIGNNDGNNSAVDTNSDTPCTSKHQRIRKRRLSEPDATEIIPAKSSTERCPFTPSAEIRRMQSW